MIIEEYLRVRGYRTVDPIIEAVSKATDVPIEDILDEKRGNRYLSDVRFLCVYLLRKHRKYLGWQGIAERMNRGDHSTAIYAYQKAKDLVDTCEQFRQWLTAADGQILQPKI